MQTQIVKSSNSSGISSVFSDTFCGLLLPAQKLTIMKQCNLSSPFHNFTRMTGIYNFWEILKLLRDLFNSLLLVLLLSFYPLTKVNIE